jgi:para-nitrobenzyl esterase
MAPDQAVPLRRRLFAALGLADSAAARLRDVPARDLLAAQESIAAGPTATWVWRPSLGPALPQMPVDAIAAGAARGVALLAGHNGNEGATYQAMEPTAAAQAPRVLGELFGPAEAAAMLQGYAAARPDLDEAGVHLAVLGDERYGIPTHRLVRAQAGHAAVWRYRLDAAPPGVPAALAGGHGLDAVLVWGSDHDPRARLGRAMADAWASFARTGDPGSALGRWAPYTVDRPDTLVLEANPHVQSAPDVAITALWPDRTWPSGTWWAIEGVS